MRWSPRLSAPGRSCPTQLALGAHSSIPKALLRRIIDGALAEGDLVVLVVRTAVRRGMRVAAGTQKARDGVEELLRAALAVLLLHRRLGLHVLHLGVGVLLLVILVSIKGIFHRKTTEPSLP